MNHLHDSNMSWWKHAKKAWKLSSKLLLLSLAAFLHGLAPFMFTKTVSNGVKKMSENL